MTVKVDKKLFAAAVKALGIDVPIASAWMEKGAVCISTRNGVQRWKPPVKAKAKAKAKPKAPAKKVTTPKTPGAAAKRTGARKK